ncbi:Fc.00g009880.m01.CDS01 [Cosmosporella sp. VM-42]
MSTIPMENSESAANDLGDLMADLAASKEQEKRALDAIREDEMRKMHEETEERARQEAREEAEYQEDRKKEQKRWESLEAPSFDGVPELAMSLLYVELLQHPRRQPEPPRVRRRRAQASPRQPGSRNYATRGYVIALATPRSMNLMGVARRHGGRIR